VEVDKFTDSPVGRLVPIVLPLRGKSYDHFAFVPHPLPNEIPLSDHTYMAVSRADQELGKLEGIASMLPNRDLLVRPIIRREAVSTSALEGTYAGLSEILEAEVAESPPPREEVREVLN
jgi:Fic family protein